MKKLAILLLSACMLTPGKSQEMYARWSFEGELPTETLEEISNQKDKIVGFSDPVRGVENNAIRFDGFTSFIERPRLQDELPEYFTINAWIALEAYPWFRVPVLDIRKGEKEGLVFGIDKLGHLCVGLGFPSDWINLKGPKLDIGKWMMVSLSVEQGGKTAMYLNGVEVASTGHTPILRNTKDSKVTIGRNAILEEWWDYQYVATENYSFLDGSLDELIIFNGLLSADEIRTMHKGYIPYDEYVKDVRVLPVGPEEPSEFGADYTRLNYTDQWDRLWRVGDYPDVLVRFADNNCRLVFWRGTSFVPCWVTENGIWYTNEWMETWGSDVTSCAEPLMDRDCRYSHVRIIENTPARTIVHWRYGLVDTEYTFVAKDVDGRGEWADEYYIIYPDGIGIRKIDLHYSKPLRKHDWEEAIVLLSPGQHPDDVMQDPEITLGNMEGETYDYSWRNDLPVEMKEPEGANIHMVNFKAEYNPFYIIPPDPFESAEGKFDSPFFRTYSAGIASTNYRPKEVPSVYGWWNHWPVTPVPGDGRWVVNNDRASHFNLTTFTQWKDYYMDESLKSRIMLHGMTNKKTQELVPLAKSWLEPPELHASSGSAYYEPAERAYIISGQDTREFSVILKASKENPAVKPAFVLKNTKLPHPEIKMDGKIMKSGKDFHLGIVKELEGWKTIIWIDKDFQNQTEIEIR